MWRWKSSKTPKGFRREIFFKFSKKKAWSSEHHQDRSQDQFNSMDTKIIFDFEVTWWNIEQEMCLLMMNLQTGLKEIKYFLMQFRKSNFVAFSLTSACRPTDFNLIEIENEPKLLKKVDSIKYLGISRRDYYTFNLCREKISKFNL